MKERNIGIDFLKAIAILMIANFHAGRMYPRFAFLATGGDVGNAIFFFVSGLTLLPSVKKSAQSWGEGGAWYARRLSRIIPSLLAWSIIAYVMCSVGIPNVDTRIFTSFSAFTGGPYWFVRCILVYYIIYWVFVKYASGHMTAVLAFVLAVLFCRYFYVVSWTGADDSFAVHAGIRDWIGLSYMMLGGVVAQHCKDYKPTLPFWAFAAAVGFGIYLFVHYVGMHGHGWHWLVLAWNVPLMVFCISLYFVSQADGFARMLNISAIRFLIIAIGSLTLEVYICHFTFVDTRFNYLFPLNIVCFFLLSFCLAYVAKVASRLVRLILSGGAGLQDGFKGLFRIA